jgi:hypothetical protein
MLAGKLGLLAACQAIARTSFEGLLMDGSAAQLNGSACWLGAWTKALMVALYRTGVLERNADLDRTIVEARPDGWIYAGRLGTGRWVFGYHTGSRDAARLKAGSGDDILADAPDLQALLGHVRFDAGVLALDTRCGAG